MKKELRKIYAETLVEVIKGDIKLHAKATGIKTLAKKMIKNELAH